MSPRIGIIGNPAILGGDFDIYSSGRMMVAAVSQVARGLPLVVPASPTHVQIGDLLEVIDGLVLAGGGPNVHPSAYGEPETPAHGPFDRARDALTLPLVRAAVDRGIALLGICRGFQEINVAFGGTLHPEIRDLPGRQDHRMPRNVPIAQQYAPRHPVRLETGGIFADLIGTEEIRVNSLHGQGIKTPGARIRIEGRAGDGTPEALHVEDSPGFALAVQWHPEWNAENDPVSRALFTAFGDAARRHGQRRA